MTESQLTGRVLHRGDPGWERARRNFNARIDPGTVEPKTIVFVQNADDVRHAVAYARARGLPLRIRCGGHSYEAYSLVKDGLVIDVSDINYVRYEQRTGHVAVGAGARCLDVAEKLAGLNRLVPLPTFASVGVAGGTLGGGAGIASRKFGLTIDNLVSAKMVAADGRLLTASDAENIDLFWALKGGGGGNFGVVMEFTFRTHAARNVVGFQASWDWAQFETVVDQWQRWAYAVEPGMTAILDLRADGKLIMMGQYTPDSNEGWFGLKAKLELLLGQVPILKQLSGTLRRANVALAQLFDKIAPAKAEVRLIPLAIANRVFAQVEPKNPDWRAQLREQQIFKSTSSFAFEPLPREALAKLRAAIETSPKRGGEKNFDQDMVRLLPGGGAALQVPAESSAVDARGARILLQYDAYWDDPEDNASNTAWVEGMRRDLGPYTRGAYVNYHDSLIDEPQLSYYGAKLRKLVAVKAKYDPDNVFHYPQSVPTALSREQEAALSRAESRAPEVVR
jgi:FAD/FMN-containing dehydrogenase